MMGMAVHDSIGRRISTPLRPNLAAVLEDAERLIAAWNERQAKRMPMLFSASTVPP